MANIYLTEQGALLKKSGKRIIVEKNGVILADLETHRIETLLLYGNIQFTTQALKSLLKNNIELALLSQSGRIYGQLTPPLPKNILLREVQFRKCSDIPFCRKQARNLVMAKIINSIEVLKQLYWNNKNIDFSRETRVLQQILIKAESCETLPALNGIEGSAANTYFSAFRKAFKTPSLFNGRSKRPPKDPANAIMSFGYTILASLIQSHLDAAGFDPYLGFYHRIAYGRPSLALDLLEVFRAPLVDRFVVRLFNLKILTIDDFNETGKGGWRLTQKGVKIFFVQWDTNLSRTGFRQAIRKQAESVARTFKDEIEYPKYYKFRAK